LGDTDRHQRQSAGSLVPALASGALRLPSAVSICLLVIFSQEPRESAPERGLPRLNPAQEGLAQVIYLFILFNPPPCHRHGSSLGVNVLEKTGHTLASLINHRAWE